MNKINIICLKRAEVVHCILYVILISNKTVEYLFTHTAMLWCHVRYTESHFIQSFCACNIKEWNISAIKYDDCYKHVFLSYHIRSHHIIPFSCPVLSIFFLISIQSINLSIYGLYYLFTIAWHRIHYIEIYNHISYVHVRTFLM